MTDKDIYNKDAKMENKNILHNNLLFNDPDMAQGLLQGAPNVAPPQQVGGGGAGGIQPAQNVQNQAVHDLANLID